MMQAENPDWKLCLDGLTNDTVIALGVQNGNLIKYKSCMWQYYVVFVI